MELPYYIEPLNTLTLSGGKSHLGYGPPSELTKQLVQDGYIELVFPPDKPGLWFGKLTSVGSQAISGG